MRLWPHPLNQLSSFLAVAREGSVSAAAEKLYVTQPSISAAVSALSRELGVDLTERVGRGIGLTAAGEAFRPYAADVLGLIEQGRQAAREAADFSMRSLRIVAVATAAEYVVPSLLRAFAGLHPEINLALEVANRATVFERVLEHEVDVAIAGRPPEDERIAGLAFLHERARADRRARRPARRQRAGQPERARRPRLAACASRARARAQLVAEFLAEHDLRPQTLTLGSNGAIKEAVRLGLGVSLQSRVAVEHELAAGTLAEIDGARRPAAAASGTRSTRRPCRRGPRSQLFLEFANGPERPARLRGAGDA